MVITYTYPNHLAHKNRALNMLWCLSAPATLGVGCVDFLDFSYFSRPSQP